MTSTHFDANTSPLIGHSPAVPVDGAWSRHQLHLATQGSVRQMRRSANGLTAKDQNYMKAFSRGQYLSGVMRLVEIGLKCEDVADATAFPEALRGFTVQHHPRAHVCVGEAFRAESYANGEFDAAQIAYAAEPTEANRLWAIETGNKQLIETIRSLNALHRPGGRLILARS